jgi:hypothetical protein
MGEVVVKGSTTERGYGSVHQRTRAAWRAVVDSGGVACARCGCLIEPGSLWDLGHVDGDKSRYAGPEHRRCNRAAGARRGHRLRAVRRRVTSLGW